MTARGPLDPGRDAGQVGLASSCARICTLSCSTSIGHAHRLPALFGCVHHRQPPHDADLRRGKTDAGIASMLSIMSSQIMRTVIAATGSAALQPPGRDRAEGTNRHAAQPAAFSMRRVDAGCRNSISGGRTGRATKAVRAMPASTPCAQSGQRCIQRCRSSRRPRVAGRGRSIRNWGVIPSSRLSFKRCSGTPALALNLTILRVIIWRLIGPRWSMNSFAIQMVDLVLGAGRPKPVEIALMGLAVQPQPAHAHLGGRSRRRNGRGSTGSPLFIGVQRPEPM